MSRLLATKLHRPSTPLQQIRRQHLLRRLHEGLAAGHPLTLVSAPAGFGKTTCIGEWLDTLDDPVAWLSLDAGDDDPGRFFAYLVAALQGLRDDLGRELGGVLHAGQIPPVEAISATLIDDILNLDTRFLLVLDDFHVIQDRTILQVLESMLANPPPTLHLVLITREDPSLPLARLRGANRLTEVRATDLRFTLEEAGAFLSEILNLSLSPADIAMLEEKTEGWIVGLQLAGLSIRDRADPTRFISGLTGSHRFILGYLTEQVLDRQPAEIRQFLLQTSILDRLSGDLCDAITGRLDSHHLLEQLHQSNLFLIPLDDEGRWYRYHHLFADLLHNLQRTLHKEDTTELHQRAGHWYAAAGMVTEAIGHALAAQDFGTAVELLEEHAMDMLMQGYAKTVHGWVETIPPEVADSQPQNAPGHRLGGCIARRLPPRRSPS